MGGAALAQVQLDRVRPSTRRLVLARQRSPPRTDRARRAARDGGRSPSPARRWSRRSRGPPGTRSRGTSGRSRRREAGRGWRATRRCRPAVPASGRSGCVSTTPVIRSSTMPPPFSKAARKASTVILSDSGCIPRTRSAIAAASSGDPGIRQPGQVHHRVARARDALVQLHDRLAQRRLSRAHAPAQRATMSSSVRRSSAPDRIPHPAFLEHPAAAGLACRGRRSQGPRRTSECRATARHPARAAWCCRE